MIFNINLLIACLAANLLYASFVVVINAGILSKNLAHSAAPEYLVTLSVLNLPNCFPKHEQRRGTCKIPSIVKVLLKSTLCKTFTEIWCQMVHSSIMIFGPPVAFGAYFSKYYFQREANPS